MGISFDSHFEIYPTHIPAKVFRDICRGIPQFCCGITFNKVRVELCLPQIHNPRNPECGCICRWYFQRGD